MQVYTRMQQCILYLNIRSVEMRRSASANPVDAIGGIGGIGGIGYYWPVRYWTSVIGYHRLLVRVVQVSSLPRIPWMGSQIPKYEAIYYYHPLIVIGFASLPLRTDRCDLAGSRAQPTNYFKIPIQPTCHLSTACTHVGSLMHVCVFARTVHCGELTTISS